MTKRPLIYLIPAILLAALVSFTSCNDPDPEEPELKILFTQPGDFELGEIKEIPYTLPAGTPESIVAEEVPTGWTVEILQADSKIKVTNSEDYPEGGKDGTAQIVLKSGKVVEKFPLNLKSLSDMNANLTITFTQPEAFTLGEIKEVAYTCPDELPASIEAEDVTAGWNVEVVTADKVFKVTCDETFPEGGKDGTATILLKDSKGKYNKATLELKAKQILTISFEQPEQFTPGETKYISYTLPQLQPTSITIDEVPAGWEMNLQESENKIEVICSTEYPDEGKNGTAQIVLALDGDTKKFPVTLTCKGKAGMVLINAGTFTMGSPETEEGRMSWEAQHQVTLTRDFWMSKTEVTVAQYLEFLNANNIRQVGSYAVIYDEGYEIRYYKTSGHILHDGDAWFITESEYANYPMEFVSWEGAQAYAEWRGGSLPTEAQWEYACRAGNTAPFGLGNGRKLTLEIANIHRFQYDLDRAEGIIYQNTAFLNRACDVASYAPNAWGLYDMHGNVMEWCLDKWEFGEDYSTEPATDPIGTTGMVRVQRGGAYNSDAAVCRSAYRTADSSTQTAGGLGFRIIIYDDQE